MVDAQGNVLNVSDLAATPTVLANSAVTPVVLTTGDSANITVPASVLAGNSTANATLLTMDPHIG